MSGYLNFVRYVSENFTENEDQLSEEFISDEFGIGYDCPPLPQLYQLMTHIAGSSICAANAIAKKSCDIAINWFGGWHHSQRDEASGYCYTNDIVMAVLHLLDNGFDKVLYVDLDLHHCDGVENAFAHSSKSGADGLNGDPMNAFNLTINGYSECIKYLISMNKPLILLGGGGYHPLNTARLWAALTACALNETLDNDIPDHSCFLAYRPSYELNIEAGLRPNLNSKQYIE
ncbi:unnamed protein product, partial [Oppiella nova]